MQRSVTILTWLALASFGTTSIAPVAAVAQSAGGTVRGAITAQTNGLNVGGAAVTLVQGDTTVATTTSDDNGTYTFANAAAGIYSVVIRATGYASTRIDNVVVTANGSVELRTPLLRANTSSSDENREVIGTTQTTGVRGNTLAAQTTIQTNLDPTQLQRQGFVKAADALGQVPGVNLTGGPHTIGDDTSIDIRGLGAGEVRPLIDGHPIGPIGVFSQDYYNYVNSPYALLQNIQVTVGSGAAGLYGVDVIGGVIDFQTLQPTKKPVFDFTQEYGDYGTLGTILKATGSLGNFGYALGHSVTGTYGPLVPEPVFQGARPNNDQNMQNGGACLPTNSVPGNPSITVPDFTQCNTNLNTYPVSGNFKTLNDVAKLRYNFTPSTALTFTVYTSNTAEDSTGNGDNDFLPYATRYAALTGNGNCNNNTGFYATIDGNPLACLSQAQFAAETSGPDGGGADRHRGTTLQDFNATFTTQIGRHAISVDAYSDYYNFHKNSTAAAGLSPNGLVYTGNGTYTDNYLTHGFLVTDDIVSADNDLGFGYFVEHQQTSGNNGGFDATSQTYFYTPQPLLGEGDYSFFFRDNFTPTPQFSVFLNAWDRRSSVTQKTTFDPRLSLVYKPTGRDVIRVTGGEADGDPGINVAVSGSLSGFNNPSSLNPTCNPLLLNNVATEGNPNLVAERSRDLEAAYGHRFWSDTAINVVAYASSVSNQLFTGVQPITPLALAALGPTALAGFASKINASCPGTNYDATTVASVLGVTQVFNAQTALYRGIETTGRIRATKQFAVDFMYDIQSSQQFDEGAALLINNPYLLDGGQIVAIPLQKGSLTLDYANAGFEAQIEGYFVGNNNTLNRPAYTYFNGFATKQLTKNVSFTVSGYNLFNQIAQAYGYFGEQLPHAVNQYQTQYSDPIAQYNAYGGSNAELFGLQPRLFSASVNIRF